MRTNSLSKQLEKEVRPLSFGGFIRSARTMRDLSQTDMADYLGVSKSTLCDIEKGRQLVSIDLASKIAKKCELSEVVAVEMAIRDQLRKSGLKFDVIVKKPRSA